MSSISWSDLASNKFNLTYGPGIKSSKCQTSQHKYMLFGLQRVWLQIVSSSKQQHKAFLNANFTSHIWLDFYPNMMWSLIIDSVFNYRHFLWIIVLAKQTLQYIWSIRHLFPFDFRTIFFRHQPHISIDKRTSIAGLGLIGPALG